MLHGSCLTQQLGRKTDPVREAESVGTASKHESGVCPSEHRWLEKMEKKTDGEVEHPGGKVDNSTEMIATE